MLESMTGSATLRRSRGKEHIRIELRSTNSRSLDLIVNGPPELQVQTGQALRQFFSRGRIEVDIEYHCPPVPQIDAEQLARYRKAVQKAGLTLPDSSSAMGWLALPGVLHRRREAGRLATGLFLKQACALLRKARLREGRQLVRIMQGRIRELQQLKKKVTLRYHWLKSKEPGRWQKSWAEISVGDDRREFFEQWFEKQNIQEELDRLELHLKEIANLLAGQKAPGRELDFLFQELLRELNTATAKLKDFTIRRQLVRMKALTDELKEQARNLC